MQRLKKEHPGITDEYIGIGVDRLEYTKALIKRLQAIDLFFDRYERFRRKFTFIQIAVPTRMREPYIRYKKAVEELVSKINEKYSVGDWKPIIYIDTKIEHKELAAYYKMADFAIISSVYDGMNLVAKEYVASKTDKKGVLRLSEFAGAFEELKGSILENPYDIEQFSECIKTALKMPDKEKVSRMAALRRKVSENNIHGAKIHDPKDPGADLSAMPYQVVGATFDLMETYSDAWKNIKDSESVITCGFQYAVGLEPVNVNVDRMIDKYRLGVKELMSV